MRRRWFYRRQWPTAPDGFSIVIPTSWTVPGAQAAPTSPNRKLAEGSLRATSATVHEIATSGAELPSPLLWATAQPDGDRSGVSIGVYDVAAGADLGSLREAIRGAVPGQEEVTEVGVARLDGLEVVRTPVDAPGSGLLYTTDLWVDVPGSPDQFAVLRFWRVGSTWDDDAASLERAIADTFLFLLPGQFQGRLNRWAIRRWGYFKPPDAWDLSAPAQDEWRAAGWRLGVVFHTAQLTRHSTLFFTATERPKDALLSVAVFVAWIAVVYGFLADRTQGAGDWVFYGGSGPILAWAQGLRRGRRSMLGLLATLGAILGLGFAFG